MIIVIISVGFARSLIQSLVFFLLLLFQNIFRSLSLFRTLTWLCPFKHEHKFFHRKTFSWVFLPSRRLGSVVNASKMYSHMSRQKQSCFGFCECRRECVWYGLSFILFLVSFFSMIFCAFASSTFFLERWKYNNSNPSHRRKWQIFFWVEKFPKRIEYICGLV